MVGARLRWLFGHDVFVSYSRADGLAYASSLAYRLGQTQTSAYADIFGSEPGATTPADVTRALQQASVLVVLCTPAALKSAAVLDEIRRFPARRPVLPICLGVDQVTLAAWSDRLLGLAASVETKQALVDAAPSETVVRRISEAAGRWRQSRRLRWTVGSSALALVLLAVATGVATLNAQRLVAAASVARNEKEQLVQQSAQLQGEIASAATTLAATRQSLQQTGKWLEMASKQASATGNSLAEEIIDSDIRDQMRQFAQVECYSGGFAKGPLVVPFHAGQTRLARVARNMLEDLAECLRSHSFAVELLSLDRGDGAPAALKNRQRQAVKDHLVSLGVRSRMLTSSEQPPALSPGSCQFACVVIVRRQSE